MSDKESSNPQAPKNGDAGNDKTLHPIRAKKPNWLGQVWRHAKTYCRGGWSPVPVPDKGKDPRRKEWQKMRLKEEEIHDYFMDDPMNVGIILGDASGGLVDIDLDVPEAAKAAEMLLPKTGTVFGRDSKPDSHRFYWCDPLPPFELFKDIDGTMLVELRSNNGHLTIVPPSVHESGEAITWTCSSRPAEISGQELRKHVAKVAAAALLARHWPEKGCRQEAALALTGGLLRCDWSAEAVETFIRAVAAAAGDEEAAMRLNTIKGTAEKLRNGSETTGWPTLAGMVSQEVVDSVRRFLDSRSTPGGQQESEDQVIKLVSLSELLSRPDEPVEYVIEGLLPTSGLSLLVAKPKVGKSTLARVMALSVAAGGEFLDRSTSSGPVIHLNLEDKESAVKEHFRRMGASDEPIYLHFDQLVGDFDKMLASLEHVVRETGAVLVVIDTLFRFCRIKDGNDYAGVTRAMDPLLHLARSGKSHIMMLHHSPKSSGRGGDDVLGSTALFGTVDTLLRLKGSGSAPRVLSSEQRGGDDMPDTTLHLDKETGCINSSPASSFHNSALPETIKALLLERGELGQDEIRNLVGGNHTLTSKALKHMTESEQICREGTGLKGSPHRYSLPAAPLEDSENRQSDPGTRAASKDHDPGEPSEESKTKTSVRFDT